MEELELEVEGEEEDKSRCIICLIGCRRVTTFLLSHVGLVSLVVAYCLLGAVTFERLEREHELDVKRNMSNVREEVSDYIWKMTNEVDYINETAWLANATARLQVFETELIRLMKKGGWDGDESLETQQWTFSGALFYSIVVITTIGFGHITPKTDWGKVVTIFYAILGIPLMLLCLSHIGDFMATAFRVLYWKVCCYVCYRQPRPSRAAPTPAMSRTRSLRNSGASRQSRGVPRRPLRSSTDTRTSDRSDESAFSDSAIQFSATDRCPRRVHSQEDFRKPPAIQHSEKRYSRRSARPVYRSQQLQSESENVPTRYLQRSVHSEPRSSSQVMPSLQQLPVWCNKYADDAMRFEMEDTDAVYRPRNAMIPSGRNNLTVEDFTWDEEDYQFQDDIEKRHVPIWLCVFLVFSYILGGAALFSNWEQWPFLDSAYFCFITLTTIGFGDFVPAQKVKTDVEVSIALCSLYLLFGISLLAMSFNLVQEEVINSVKQIGYGLGIIREEDEK